MNSKFADDPNAIVNPGSGKESFRKTYENVKPFSAKKLIQVSASYIPLVISTQLNGRYLQPACSFRLWAIMTSESFS